MFFLKKKTIYWSSSQFNQVFSENGVSIFKQEVQQTQWLGFVPGYDERVNTVRNVNP